MEWMLNNWYLIIAFLAAGFVLGSLARNWLNKPTNEQIASLKEWLVYAVTKAEQALGGKTGQLKLRMVYDAAIERFSWLSIIPFSTFSDWVDEALVEMKDMLKNEHIAEIVASK